MDTIVKFRCPCCGMMYSDAETCLRCEKSHLHPARVVSSVYAPNPGDDNKRPPVALNVEMEDGTFASYSYQRALSLPGGEAHEE